MEQAQTYLDPLSDHFKDVPVVKTIAEKLNVPTSYVAIGSVLVVFLMVFLGLGSGLIVNLVGILYPAYMSFKAIESEDPEDDKQWLTYWAVFAIYSFADHFIDILFFWVPFYHTIKLIVLIYMFWPKTRGALVVYDMIIRPYFKMYEEKIESSLKGLAEATKTD